MSDVIATATEMQNNFGRYLGMVMEGKEVVVTKNGREVARLLPRESVVSFLTDSLIGILKDAPEYKAIREERLKEKYDMAD